MNCKITKSLKTLLISKILQIVTFFDHMNRNDMVVATVPIFSIIKRTQRLADF